MKKELKKKKKVILTGDRPTGPLHLGHYIGSLQNRVNLQNDYDQYLIIADMQALTDNADNPEKVSKNVFEVALDYLAIGIDPKKTTIFIQSLVPEIAELTMYYLNLVSVGRLERNPTVKDEIRQKGFGKIVPAGFLMYPVSQAADITVFGADLVPVGEDQLPVLEQTNEIVRKFNNTYKTKAIKEVKALISDFPRLPGTDGKAKMGKSLGNAIYLSDSKKEVEKKIMSMYTDPSHLRVEDPGKVEGNPVFSYLDAFGKDKKTIKELKDHYKKGGLGDVKVKRYLNEVLQEFLDPIRNERERLAKDRDYIDKVLIEGTKQANKKAQEVLKEVRKAMKINYFD